MACTVGSVVDECSHIFLDIEHLGMEQIYKMSLACFCHAFGHGTWYHFYIHHTPNKASSNSLARAADQAAGA